ncbi:MAG: hypothetical protein WAO58_09815 [Fimbriimonadaceae bacterium]
MQQADRPTTRVKGRYQGENGFLIEGIGVCSATDSTVECWDMDGRLNPELTERVRANFIANRATIPLAFGRKNRFLAVRQSVGSSASLRIEGANYQWSHTLSSNEERIELLLASVEPGDKEASILSTTFNEEPPTSVDISLKKGARASALGFEFEIGEVGLAKPKDAAPLRSWQPPEGQRWRIVLGNLQVQPPYGSIRHELIAKDGSKIQYVDVKGNAIRDLKFINDRGVANQSAGPGERQYHPSFVTPGTYVAAATALITNVNPSQVAKLRITLHKQMDILIYGFPLDPKASPNAHEVSR